MMQHSCQDETHSPHLSDLSRCLIKSHGKKMIKVAFGKTLLALFASFNLHCPLGVKQRQYYPNDADSAFLECTLVSLYVIPERNVYVYTIESLLSAISSENVIMR